MRHRSSDTHTLAKTTSDLNASGSAMSGLATNPFDLSIDVGPANNDRRHNLAFDGSYTFPLDIQLSGLFHYGSPLPWSVTSVTDIYARPEPRNNRRDDDYKSADVRLSKVFKLGPHLSATGFWGGSEEHTSELQSRQYL